MNKFKEFFAIKHNLIIAICTASAIVAICIIAVVLATIRPPTNDIVPVTVQSSSEDTSSDTVSQIVVPEIVETSSTASSSSAPVTELKVEGNPASKVTESKPAEKPKDTSSKPTSKPAVPKPNKPTPPTTTTSPADGDTKLENGNWYTYWAADGQWHFDAPENGGEIILDDGKDMICEDCGGITNKNGSTCTCPPVGNMG